ncbi:MAG: PadR family transcriptional regulator [Acidobacteria bacterium]|nr:PadR family transcriptional regulator [Acidobacteriota bacterium]
MQYMEAVQLLTNLRRGVVEPCVLAVMLEGEIYGVDLARRLTALGLLASDGTLYPVLARLRSSGLVSTRWEESRSGPPRRYYRLTPEGVATVDRFIESWRTFSGAVDTILKETRR